jgi:pyridoxamine 5'-phosphate oxidase
MNASNPITQFGEWFEAATRAGLDKPNAMTLATVSREGKLSARIVLLSSFDERGFVFHTNYESQKGQAIAQSSRAALVFWWDVLGHQVRIEGRIEKTSAAESDVYFAGRPRDSQIGAWASDQSRVIESRERLEARAAEFEKKFEGTAVPRPPHWGGYRVVPDAMEFWINRDSRLHDRFLFSRAPDGAWRRERLAP